jgi:hypothetical protein
MFNPYIYRFYVKSVRFRLLLIFEGREWSMLPDSITKVIFIN